MESKETIEEAAEKHLQKWRLLNNIHLSNVLHAERCKNDFIAGAKYQQERSYSEEDMQDFAKFCLLCKDEELPYIFPKDWLKHIKKK
jgi:hypothetical protein